MCGVGDTWSCGVGFWDGGGKDCGGREEDCVDCEFRPEVGLREAGECAVSEARCGVWCVEGEAICDIPIRCAQSNCTVRLQTSQ